MQCPPPSTGSWGAWGRFGPRPEFDSDKYGKPTHIKINKVASASVDMPKTSSGPESPNLSQSDPPLTGGLGAGLVQPSHQHDAFFNLPSQAQTGNLEDSPRQNQNLEAPGDVRREPELSTHNLPETGSAWAPTEVIGESVLIRTSITCTDSRLERYHARKEHNAEMSSGASPRLDNEPGFLISTALNMASLNARNIPRLPKCGQGSSEPQSISTTAPPMATIGVTPIRAAPRDKRPLLSHYHREGSVATTQPEAHALTPRDLNLDTLSLKDIQRIQGMARAEIDRSNRKRRQDKHATANLELLHALRLPMTAKKEKKVQKQIEQYHKLGESPANWPMDPNSTPAGYASEAFARSRQEIRLQHQLEDDRAQDTTNQKSKTKATQAVETPTQDPSYFVPTETKETQRKRNPRWVTADEIRPERYETNSNEWGSANPDDATQSGDSVQAIRDGAIGRIPAHEPDPGLVGWDGNFIEPPINWERRPRMHPQKIISSFGDYEQFIKEVFHQQLPDTSFAPLPTELLMDLSLHADGIGMIPRHLTITPGNIVRRFGYSTTLENEVVESLNLTVPDEFDSEGPRPGLVFEEVGYVETSEAYSQRFKAYIQKGEPNVGDQDQEAQSEPVAQSPEPLAKEPVVSIYLRPAALADLPQLTNIYNWHIEHGPRPAEISAILESDMRVRFDEAVDNKLPFIVAVEKTRGKKQRRGVNRSNGMRSNHPIQNFNPNYKAVIVEEKIVGWGYAADWSASDYIERISAEVEIYVEPHYRMKGVGRCLMDKMMQICDRGHFAQGGYDFHCLPEKSFMYSEGGARDLHKIWFIVRTWSKPANTPEDEKAVKASDRDDEFDLWLKDWLEAWDFEQEGHLKQIGAKNGRL